KRRIWVWANLMSSITPAGTVATIAAISSLDRRKLAGDHLSNLSDSSRTAASPRLVTSSRIPSTVARTLRSASALSAASVPFFRYWIILSSLGGPAAIHQQGSARHHRGSTAGEIDDGSHHILDGAEAPELDLRQRVAPERLVGEERLRHRRLDEGRRDCVDADMMRRELDRERLGQALQSVLRGAIDGAV